MAITYPLAAPSSPGFHELKWSPMTVVGAHRSPFTGQTQTYVYPGQYWMVQVALPPMRELEAGRWEAWCLALNGQQGTFPLGDSARKTTLGNQVGILEVNAGAVANSTTLPVRFGSGGSGTLVVGDWIQIGTNLHRIVQSNAGTFDVWPRLRSAYATGTAIVYTNPQGLFRMADNSMEWSVDYVKIHGLSFTAVEAL